MFKNGLANSSGEVGKNYMRHMTASTYAIFENPVYFYRGTTMAGIVTDESINDPKRGFVGGYELETLALGLPFMAAFLDCLLYTSPSPRDGTSSRMPSSA